MEKLMLKGIKQLENNVIVINNETLKQFVDCIQAQASAITVLREDLENAKREIDSLKANTSTISTNVKNIARALEGAYKDA